jgi:hypothetical protein
MMLSVPVPVVLKTTIKIIPKLWDKIEYKKKDKDGAFVFESIDLIIHLTLYEGSGRSMQFQWDWEQMVIPYVRFL